MAQYLDLFGKPLRPKDRGYLRRAYGVVQDLPGSGQFAGALSIHFLYAALNLNSPDGDYLSHVALIGYQVLDSIIYHYAYREPLLSNGLFASLDISTETHCITTTPTREQASDVSMQIVGEQVARCALVMTGVFMSLCVLGVALLAAMGIDPMKGSHQGGPIGAALALLRLYKRVADGEYAIIKMPKNDEILRSLEGEPNKNLGALPLPSHRIG